MKFSIPPHNKGNSGRNGNQDDRGSNKDPNKNPKETLIRNLLIWAAIIVIPIVLVMLLDEENARNTSGHEFTYSQFLDHLDRGDVQEVNISGQTIAGRLKDDRFFATFAPQDTDLVAELKRHDVVIKASPPEQKVSFLGSLISWLPILFWIILMVYMFRQMNGGGGKIMSFAKSKARLLTHHKDKVSFKDVAGIDEAKQELEEIVEFLRSPRKFQKLGGRIPKGVLLIGAPGTGKTLLARAIAGEADVPFFSISGSDFVEMFVGVGASRVRDMFEQAKKNAPCILFVDEIDAVGRHRGAGTGGGNDEREQTLNQLLVEMDGFESSQGVILIAATNRPDVLDHALLRPGRFDRQVIVPRPDIKGRNQILQVHVRNVPLAPDVDIVVVARGTPGFSGADLQNLVNEAALIAARKNKKLVSMEDFEYARDKVLMGAERRSMAMTEKEKKLTAYHEAGHAIVSMHLEDSDPIHKATIIPRGQALGMVQQLPETDRVSSSISRFKADLAICMGGRVAEELIFGPDQVTSGASSDIRVATNIARGMVAEWGLSPNLGPVNYVEASRDSFHKNISEKTAQLIDEEVHKIIDEAYKTAKAILTQHADEVETLAQGLLEYETLTGDEIKDLLKGIPPKRDIAPVKKKSFIPTSSDNRDHGGNADGKKPAASADSQEKPSTNTKSASGIQRTGRRKKAPPPKKGDEKS